MAIKPIKKCVIEAVHVYGTPVPVIPEVGQTFLEGQFLSVNAAGKVVAVASGATAVSFFSTGSAVDPVTGLLQPFVPAYRITPSMSFRISITNAGVSGAVLLQTLMIASRGVSVVSNLTSLNLLDAATPLFRVIGLPLGPSNLDEGSVGDTNARVLVSVLAASIV